MLLCAWSFYFSIILMASLAFFLLTLYLTDNTRDGQNKQQSTSFPCVLINWKFPTEKAGNGISNTLNLKLFCEGACPHQSNRPSLVERGRGRVAIPPQKKRKKETLILRLACPQILLTVGSRSALQFFSRLRTPSHYAPRYLQFSQMSLKVRKFVCSGYH